MREQGPILVPLDGSETAEAAVPCAVALANALHTSVRLVTAWEGTDSEVGASFPSLATDVERGAQEYFAAYQKKIRDASPGANIETVIRAGDAATEILAEAGSSNARLIVMTTHGRSGIDRWMHGSTAGHVLGAQQLPVLAIGPHAAAAAKSGMSLKHILVPLDGSAVAEAALPVAQHLAKALGGRITLARVVRWAAEAYPFALPSAYVPDLDSGLESGAQAYLKEREAAIAGVPVDAFVIRSGPAEGLMEVAARQEVDLVVMTTHARSGLARAALGSTADRMLQAPVPILLIPDALVAE